MFATEGGSPLRMLKAARRRAWVSRHGFSNITTPFVKRFLQVREKSFIMFVRPDPKPNDHAFGLE